MVEVEVVNVWFKYPGANGWVLKNINLHVRGGEVVGVIGPTGCGKTTLLLIVAGLLKPQIGTVKVDNVPIEEQVPAIRRRIGVLFQNPDDQLFNPTVRAELAYSLKQLGLDDDEITRRIRYVLKLLNIPESLLDKPPYKLSFGQRRLVALASILVYEPEIILLDEPTSNLPHTMIDTIEDLILHARDEDRIVLITSHDVDFIARIVDRVYVMSHGEIISHGSAKDILTDRKLLGDVGLKPPTPYIIWSHLGLNKDKPLRIEDLVHKLKMYLP